MVTADLNIFLNKTMISASWVLTGVVIIRIIFGPLNYWLVLLCIGTLNTTDKDIFLALRGITLVTIILSPFLKNSKYQFGPHK